MQIVCDYSYVFSTEKFLKIQNIHISRLFQNLFNSIRSQKCFNKNLLKFPIIIEKILKQNPYGDRSNIMKNYNDYP